MSLAFVTKQLAELSQVVKQLGAKEQGKGSGKGKDQGKGAGKGKSAGKGKANWNQEWSTPNGTAKEPAWLCIPCRDEGKPGSHQKNLGWRDHCRLCNRTRAKGLLPAPYRQQAETDVEWVQEDYAVGLSAKARKNEARKQRKADQKAAGPNDRPPAGGYVAPVACGPPAPPPPDAPWSPQDRRDVLRKRL